MKKFIAMLVILLCGVALLAACGGFSSDADETVPTYDSTANRTKIGTGERSFFFEYIDKEGKIISYKILTNGINISDSLEAYKLAQFVKGEKKKDDVIYIAGTTLEKGDYWEFYINGQKAETFPTETPIVENFVYTFKLVSKR